MLLGIFLFFPPFFLLFLSPSSLCRAHFLFFYLSVFFLPLKNVKLSYHLCLFHSILCLGQKEARNHLCKETPAPSNLVTFPQWAHGLLFWRGFLLYLWSVAPLVSLAKISTGKIMVVPSKFSRTSHNACSGARPIVDISKSLLAGGHQSSTAHIWTRGKEDCMPLTVQSRSLMDTT